MASRLRFWRNDPAASRPAGTTAGTNLPLPSVNQKRLCSVPPYECEQSFQGKRSRAYVLPRIQLRSVPDDIVAGVADLVTGGSLFMLRYDIFKHWQVETQSGTESGADIYYKLEFD